MIKKYLGLLLCITSCAGTHFSIPTKSELERRCFSADQAVPLLKQLRTTDWKTIDSAEIQVLWPRKLEVIRECSSGKGESCIILSEGYLGENISYCGIAFLLSQENGNEHLESAFLTLSSYDRSHLVQAAQLYLEALSPLNENSLPQYSNWDVPKGEKSVFRTFSYTPPLNYVENGTFHSKNTFPVQFDFMQLKKDYWWLRLAMLEID